MSVQPRGVRATWSGRVSALIHAIEQNDETAIHDAVDRLSRRHRVFAPLAFAIGAFALLFDGLKLLVSNWRLTLVQILPAMWIWLAMFDLKAHLLRGKTYHVISGPVVIPVVLMITAITVASFFLNAVFAFAIDQPRPPKVRPAVETARRHTRAIVASGTVVGLMLAFAVAIVARWERPWFAIVLGAVVGLMMICYVAVPARLIGVKPAQSRRDKLSTTVVGGVVGATVCTPPYLLGRIGLLMLGVKALFIPGIFVFALGITLQAGATGAVRAIKLSAKLGGTRSPRAEVAEP